MLIEWDIFFLNLFPKLIIRDVVVFCCVRKKSEDVVTGLMIVRFSVRLANVVDFESGCLQNDVT